VKKSKNVQKYGFCPQLVKCPIMNWNHGCSFQCREGFVGPPLKNDIFVQCYNIKMKYKKLAISTKACNPILRSKLGKEL
jgi:hypothetical protein